MPGTSPGMTTHMNPHLFVYGSLMSTAGHPMGDAAARGGAAARPGDDPGPALSRELVSGRRRQRRPGAAGAWRGLRARQSGPRAGMARRLRGHRAGQRGGRRVPAPRAAGAARSGEEIAAWVYLYQSDVAGLTLVPDGRWTAGYAPSRERPCIQARARHYSQNNRLRGPIAGAGSGRTPMSSRYHEVYAAWQRDPETFWAEAAREIDWYKPWDKVFDPYAGQYGRWFTGAECNTAWNCLDRHVERGRAQPEGADLRQPRHQDDAGLHLRRAARRGGDARRRAAGPGRAEGRPGDHLHADGARGGDGDARLRAHRRHPFGRVRRVRRAGAGHPHRRLHSRRPSCRPPAASSPAASCTTSRCSTPPSTSPATSRRRSSCCSGRCRKRP